MDNTNAMVMGFMCPLGYGNSNINQTMADRSILTFFIALSDTGIFFMLQHLTKVPANFIAGNSDSKNKENERYTFMHSCPGMHLITCLLIFSGSVPAKSKQRFRSGVGFLVFFASDEKG